MATRARQATLLLRLYIAGNAPNSLRAVTNVKAICEQHFAAGHQLEIVDLLVHPLRALADGIVVTPTLLKVSPLPMLRVIGDLSDTLGALTLLASK